MSEIFKYVGWFLGLLLGAAFFHSLAYFFALSMPDWLAQWVFLIFLAYFFIQWAAKGDLGLGGAGSAIGSTVKASIEHLWPFIIGPVTVLVVAITPVMVLAPKTFEFEFARALSPLVVLFGAWSFWRFSRLQEVSRDFGAWIALILSSIVVLQSLLSDNMRIMSVAILVMSPVVFLSYYMIGIDRESTASKAYTWIGKLTLALGLAMFVLSFIVESDERTPEQMQEVIAQNEGAYKIFEWVNERSTHKNVVGVVDQNAVIQNKTQDEPKKIEAISY